MEVSETEDKLFVKMQFTHDKMVLTESITVADKRLRVSLSTVCDDTVTPESTALHTYFNIQAKGAEVVGLDSVPYFDKVENKRVGKLDTPLLQGFNEHPIDRVFEKPCTDTLRLVNSTQQRTIVITLLHATNVITWNPCDQAKSMGDVDSPDNFVCVEAADLAGGKQVEFEAWLE